MKLAKFHKEAERVFDFMDHVKEATKDWRRHNVLLGEFNRTHDSLTYTLDISKVWTPLVRKLIFALIHDLGFKHQTVPSSVWDKHWVQETKPHIVELLEVFDKQYHFQGYVLLRAYTTPMEDGEPHASFMDMIFFASDAHFMRWRKTHLASVQSAVDTLASFEFDDEQCVTRQPDVQAYMEALALIKTNLRTMRLLP